MTTQLTDDTLEAVLSEHQPMLLLFSNGDDLRSDFSIAFKKAQQEHPDIAFATVRPADSPAAVERFKVGRKAELLAYYNGEILVRRSRPWGTDVPLAVEMLREAVKVNNLQPESLQASAKPNPTNATNEANNDTTNTKGTIVDNKPVNVTDDTFQQEVIDYELPVVVDFWAEWCGPCRMVAPILDKLAEEFAGKVRVAKVDVDANPGLSQTFQIMSIPTLMMLKERTIVFSQPGALPEPALRDLFQQLVDLEIPPQEEQEAATEAEE